MKSKEERKTKYFPIELAASIAASWPLQCSKWEIKGGRKNLNEIENTRMVKHCCYSGCNSNT